MRERRSMMLALAALAVMPLAACANKPLRPANEDGTYCYKASGKSRRRTCTPAPIPAGSVELEAKQFRPASDSFTVYVVRNRWADATRQITLSVDDRAEVTTVPVSMVRLHLAPGEHRLRIGAAGDAVTLTLTGAAGELRFVELVGFWSSGAIEHRLEPGSIEVSKDRASVARLIADIDLRRRPG